MLAGRCVLAMMLNIFGYVNMISMHKTIRMYLNKQTQNFNTEQFYKNTAYVKSHFGVDFNLLQFSL